MKTFSYQDRTRHIKNFQQNQYDLVIIGGGINGAGVARDAASRGMKVALVEAQDFAAGTSSRSSKLIHGGIRYLENMEFKLVFEALNERTRLFEMAPHLVHPLRFMIPIYKNSRVGMFKMGLGMWLYDALALFQAPEMHESLNAKESLGRMPALRAEELCGSHIYSDAYMDDDRLVLETLRAANELGAHCANYVKAVGAEFDPVGKISSVQCVDQNTQQKFSIKTKHVISCVGPWTDQVGAKLVQQWKNILRPTKGIHLTLPKNKLPLSSAVVMGAEKSDRIVFGIPRHEMIIVGTTDTDFKSSPETVGTDVEDVNYLLKILSEYFPGAHINSHDIIASYAGVRPLVNDGASTEGKTSREHVILENESGITFVAGGKYTTYRLIAEQTVDAALRQFSFEEKMKWKDPSTTQALNSWVQPEAFQQAQILADFWAEEFVRPLPQVQLLAERYGMEAAEILQSRPARDSYWQLEASQAIQNTMCCHLVDFYTRRVPLFLADRNHGMHEIPEVSVVFQEMLGWSEDQLAHEVQELKNYMAHELAWKKQMF